MHVRAWSYTYVTYVLSLSDLFSVNIIIILRYFEKRNWSHDYCGSLVCDLVS